MWKSREKINNWIPKLITQSNQYTNKILNKLRANVMIQEFEDKASSQLRNYIRESGSRFKEIKSGGKLDNVIKRSLESNKSIANNILNDDFYTKLNWTKEHRLLRQNKSVGMKNKCNSWAKEIQGCAQSYKKINTINNHNNNSNNSNSNSCNNNNYNYNANTNNNNNNNDNNTNTNTNNNSRINNNINRTPSKLTRNKDFNTKNSMFTQPLKSVDNNYVDDDDDISVDNKETKPINKIDFNACRNYSHLVHFLYQLFKGQAWSPEDYIRIKIRSFNFDDIQMLKYIKPWRPDTRKLDPKENEIDLIKWLRYSKKGNDNPNNINHLKKQKSLNKIVLPPLISPVPVIVNNADYNNTLALVKNQAINNVCIEEKFNRKKNIWDTKFNYVDLPRLEEYDKIVKEKLWKERLRRNKFNIKDVQQEIASGDEVEWKKGLEDTSENKKWKQEEEQDFFMTGLNYG